MSYLPPDASASPNVVSSQDGRHMTELLDFDIKFPKKNMIKCFTSGERQPIEYALLTERLEYLLEAINSLAFDGLESVMTKYYTSDFRSSPRLASLQSLSRNQKLPVVLSELTASATSWSEWEAKGYKSEIIRSAASIFTAEQNIFLRPLALSHFMGKYEKCNSWENAKGGGPNLAILIATFQREVKFLWMLFSLLTVESGYAETRDNMRQALALMLILCCRRSIPRGKLFEMLAQCLFGE
ncbi:hypothetical protein GGI35DRAFT_448894 [Trichoderma velutinum]